MKYCTQEKKYFQIFTKEKKLFYVRWNQHFLGQFLDFVTRKKKKNASECE